MEVGFYAKQEPRLRGQHDALKQRKDLYPHSSESVRESSCPLDKDLSLEVGLLDARLHAAGTAAVFTSLV
jgi:hypothetical protein